MPKTTAVQLLKDVFELNEQKTVNVQASRLRKIGYEPPGEKDLDENGEPFERPVPGDRFCEMKVVEVRRHCRACIDRCNAPPEDTMPPSPEDATRD